ncbi:MAG: holo-ACP synthase [Oscillatoria princeps RMCB-10]|jgi:holo-[acyl-carrier protein] synthase|nr:holo-ACP synthase [Oscillatoria princeps RMCB-10]
MLIGIGHDIQLISELKSAESLRVPGFFFTDNECLYFNGRKNSLQSIAGIFAAKEAFFKAIPRISNFHWTDVEVLHDVRHAPYFRLHGSLQEYFASQGWTANLSISHSGEYVSTVVVVSAGQKPQQTVTH